MTHTAEVSRFASLAEELTGRVVVPGEDGWDLARTPWNLAIDQHPDAVVYAATEHDVAATVRFAVAHGLRVAPQGTGHLAAALPDLAGTVLLKTEYLTSITVDGRSVTVGAGVTWGTLTDALRGHGLAGLYGTSDGVGVIGYTIGGGIGWVARAHGLACSRIRSARVVDGSGRIADASNDLLWALRGGGGGHAIITSLTFDADPIADVYAGSLWYPIDRAPDVIAAYHEWTADLADAATTAVRVMRIPDAPFAPEPLRGKAFTILQGSLLDDGSALGPLRALGPITDTFRMTTTDAMTAVHLAPSDPSPTAGDGFVIDDLPADALEVVLEQIGAGAETPLAVVEFRHLGGVLDRPGTPGALTRLPGRYLVKTGNVAPDPDAYDRVMQACATLNTALAPWCAQRDYLNFREIPVAGDRLFDAETLDELTRIKRAHDPANVIVGSQSPWRLSPTRRG